MVENNKLIIFLDTSYEGLKVEQKFPKSKDAGKNDDVCDTKVTSIKTVQNRSKLTGTDSVDYNLLSICCKVIGEKR